VNYLEMEGVAGCTLCSMFPAMF